MEFASSFEIIYWSYSHFVTCAVVPPTTHSGCDDRNCCGKCESCAASGSPIDCCRDCSERYTQQTQPPSALDSLQSIEPRFHACISAISSLGNAFFSDRACRGSTAIFYEYPSGFCVSVGL